MEPRVAYENTVGYESLQSDIEILEAHIHCDIHNYGMDMSDELIADLKGLEKMCRAAKKKMKNQKEKQG